MARGSFTLRDTTVIDRVAKNIAKARAQADKNVQRKVATAALIIYQVARQRRPYITQVQAKAEGRSRIRGTAKYHVVSDPNAEAGVPVAQINGGALQASIKKETYTSGGKFFGRVYVDAPGAQYASYLEYGTPKMQARPFMRPAVNLTMEAVKAMLKK